MAEKAKEEKIARVAKGAMLPRFVIVGLGLAYFSIPMVGAEGSMAVIGLSLALGWLFQNRYDQATDEGIADGKMYIKRGESKSWK